MYINLIYIGTKLRIGNFKKGVRHLISVLSEIALKLNRSHSSSSDFLAGAPAEGRLARRWSGSRTMAGPHGAPETSSYK